MAASLVLICHSAKLADGLLELVQQIARSKVVVFAAGGLDKDTLGSNPEQIRSILECAENPEGTLVLMDLGSSILATEMALSEWPVERRARVLLCDAPLVEGAVAAATQLSAGASLQEAAAEACNALQPKQAQLGAPPPQDAPAHATALGTDSRLLILTHPMGLHARPAALFVQTAQRFRSEISVRHGQRQANAKSITSILTLGANQGAEIELTAEGIDAQQALAALTSLVQSDFAQRP